MGLIMIGILEQYAKNNGWRLLAKNILVEGESDQTYFELASRVYESRTGRSLVGRDLSVFPPGAGSDGGTFGILKQFSTIRNLSDWDVDRNNKRRFHVVTLLDSDSAGTRAAKAITQQNLSLEKWRDVFQLKRVLPRTTTRGKGLEKAVAEANKGWNTLDTVIEDLVGITLFELFCESNERFAELGRKECAGHFHYLLPSDAKSPFLRFVVQNADYESIEGLIEIVRSMRYYVGLDPDGC